MTKKKVNKKKVLKALNYIEKKYLKNRESIIDFMMSKPIKLNFNNECFQIVAKTEKEIKYHYNSEVNNND